MVLLSNFGKREVRCSFKKLNLLGWKYKFQSMVKIAGTSHFFFFSVASCDLEAGIRMALLIRGCGLSILGNYCTSVTHLHICTLHTVIHLHTAHCTSVTHLQISAATPPSASKLLKIESLTNKLLTVGGFLRRLGKRLDKFDRHFAEDTKCYNPRTRR